MNHRKLLPNEIDIKVGIDGGQGFLKCTASITYKPDERDQETPQKRIKYSEGYEKKGFKDSSVFKTLILAIVPHMDESYVNLRMLIEKLNIGSLDYSFSEDIKVQLQMVGKQCASSKHPCPFCETEIPLLPKAKANTISSLHQWHQKWLENGSKLSQAKKFQNSIHPPVTGDPEKKIVEIINIPGLHILLGIVDKIISEIEKNMFKNKEDGFNFMSAYLKSINLGRVSYQGQHRLEGNASNIFLKKVDILNRFFCTHGLGIHGAKYIKALISFKKVIEGCFGKKLCKTYKNDIKKFSDDYRNLGASVTVKVHIVEQHIVEFIDLKGSTFGKCFFTGNIY